MVRTIIKPNFCKVIACIIIALVLFVSCAPKTFAFLRSNRITERKTKDLVVTLNCAKNNVMKNQLLIFNKSNETISVSSNDINLRVKDSSFCLNAVADFKAYAKRRWDAARTSCLESIVPDRCSDSIDNYFTGGLDSPLFSFGSIRPREGQKGMIAFNLPDPFNESQVALRIAEILKSKPRHLDAEIIVRVHKGDDIIKVSFPVTIKIFTDRDYLPMRILTFY